MRGHYVQQTNKQTNKANPPLCLSALDIHTNTERGTPVPLLPPPSLPQQIRELLKPPNGQQQMKGKRSEGGEGREKAKERRVQSGREGKRAENRGEMMALEPR